MKALSRHPQVVVATPGRLLDLLERRVLRLDRYSCPMLLFSTAKMPVGLIVTSFSRVGYVVIDEVDKLIEGGMEAQVRQVTR